MDDALALEALVELAQKLNPEIQCQLANKKFPLLDKEIVETAIGSAAFIFENKPKLRTHCMSLIKKWCDVRDLGVSCRHLSWMGSESSLASMDCLLAVSQVLVDSNSPRNFLSLDLDQQQAMCLAITSLTDASDKARKLSVNLFEFIIQHMESTDAHSEFFAEIWKLRGVLELSLDQLELIVRKCPYGLEKELLRIATVIIRNDKSEMDIYGKEEDKTALINLCKSSPDIFQVTTSILMLFIHKSQAHQSIIDILTTLVERCISDVQNIVKLFPTKCQLPLALLSISPEETHLGSYVTYLLDSLHDLPASMSALLIILHSQWIPYLTDKL